MVAGGKAFFVAAIAIKTHHMPHSKSGTRVEATELQEGNNVKMPIRGPW